MFEWSFQFQYTNSLAQADQSPPAVKNELGLVCLLTPEQKQVKYEKMTKRLLKSSKGKIADDERRSLVGEAQDLLQWWQQQCQEYVSRPYGHCTCLLRYCLS